VSAGVPDATRTPLLAQPLAADGGGAAQADGQTNDPQSDAHSGAGVA
jgi:hypothetical protein